MNEKSLWQFKRVSGLINHFKKIRRFSTRINKSVDLAEDISTKINICRICEHFKHLEYLKPKLINLKSCQPQKKLEVFSTNIKESEEMLNNLKN